MLKEKLEQMRKTGEPFCCLGGSPQARAEWLAAGGSAAHILSQRQVESFLLTDAPFPGDMAFEGSLADRKSVV